MKEYDVILIGAGAAGLFCAAEAGRRGKKVLLIDHAPRLGEKIRISGGGKCNFTNRIVRENNFLSANPRFARHALYSFTPDHWLERMRAARLTWFEKHKGQLFCEQGSQAIVDFLVQNCTDAGVDMWHPCSVQSIEKNTDFLVQTSQGVVRAGALVIATGGLAIPQIGATDQGMLWAEQFGLPVVAPQPGLVPLRFSEPHLPAFQALAGLSLPVHIQTGKQSFTEDLLFTHKGLSGPAALQISSYWQTSQPIQINFLHEQPHWLAQLQQERSGNRSLVPNHCAGILPKRWVDIWFAQHTSLQPLQSMKMADLSNQGIADMVRSIQQWQGIPCGTEGYKKAEVMVGGIPTRALSPQTMQSKEIPGLFAIGEVVDVTGWLGGYNFQWAWSSAFICAQAL